MIERDALDIDPALLRRTRRTAGQRALEVALEHVTSVEIAARLNIHEASVSHWLRGTHAPSRATRDALRDAFGIPIESWETTRKQVRT
jgi:transcriptional regulator with XRE-family HTH domain